jgi:hypothetical protein
MIMMSAVNLVARIMNSVLKDLLTVFMLQERSGKTSSVFGLRNDERTRRERAARLSQRLDKLEVNHIMAMISLLFRRPCPPLPSP